MKFKLISAGGFASLLLAVSLTMFSLVSCGSQIQNYQLDALDDSINAMKKDAEYLLPYDPNYKDKEESYVADSIKKRLKKYSDTQELLGAIRNQLKTAEGAK